MTRADEFTSFYRSSADGVLATVYAVCGDRAVAREATVDAYQRAWRNWTKLRQHDPLAYVRGEAFGLTTLSRGTHPLRRRHEEDADTELLAALHDLDLDGRRLIVLLTLGGSDLDRASREVGVSAEEGIEAVTTALDVLEKRLGLPLEQLETRLRALRTVTDHVALPSADEVRRSGRRGQQRNTVALVVGAVVFVLLAGGLSTSGDVLGADALPDRERLGAETPDLVLEARKISADNLLTPRQIGAIDPEVTWTTGGTEEDADDETPYATGPTQRFADPDPLRVFLRTFTGDGGSNDRAVQSIEVSRNDQAAERAFDTTLGWYADCTHPRTRLVGSYAVKRPFGDFTILRLRSSRSPERVFTVGFAHSGQVTATLVHEHEGGEFPDIDGFAEALNTSVQKVCRDSGGRCGDDFEVVATNPPATSQDPGFLGVVDLPPVADVDEVWSGTGALETETNPAATQCDDADFRREGLDEVFSQVYVIPEATGVPAEFGITETVGTYTDDQVAARFVESVRQAVAGCPDRNLSAQVSQEREIEGDGYTGRTWNLRLEVNQSGDMVSLRTGIVRRGDAVAQVTLRPVGDYTVSRETFEGLVQRAGQRLVYADD